MLGESHCLVGANEACSQHFGHKFHVCHKREEFPWIELQIDCLVPLRSQMVPSGLRWISFGPISNFYFGFAIERNDCHQNCKGETKERELGNLDLLLDLLTLIALEQQI